MKANGKKMAGLAAVLIAVAVSGFAQSGPFRLEDNTPVRLRLERTLSSAESEANETVDFQVLADVTVNGAMVIPKGSVALGTVIEAQAKRRMGRGGKLHVELDSVRLADGEKCALSAVKTAKGGGHVGAMTAGMVATAIVAWPAAPLLLLLHGKDVTIPKGTEITAYTSGDMNLDASKFPAVATAVVAASATAAAKPATEQPATINWSFAQSH